MLLLVPSLMIAVWVRQWMRHRWRLLVLTAIPTAATLAGLVYWWGLGSESRPVEPVEVYPGLIYSCQPVEGTDDERNLAHLVRVDLAAPGIELYLTPVDPQARSEGFEYHLDYAERVAAREGLAIVINGVFFESRSRLRLPGGLARAVQTVISDGELNHWDPHSYLLWISADNLAHLETEIPPPEGVLQQARWAVGSGLVVLKDGKISPFAGHERDRRTALAIGPQGRFLWLTVFESASGTTAAETLLGAGARSAVLLDGGDSSAMVLGPQVSGVEPGAKMTTWRPSAAFVGVRVRTKSP